MYDLILFGVTGFTGKLALEYLLSRYNGKVKWAISARNEEKARQILSEIASSVADAPVDSLRLPDILQVDLACKNEDEINALRQIVRQTRLVLTTAGPFQLHGKTLVSLCAELGVHYCDISGETNFVRHVIVQNGAAAWSSGAVIIPHCGNDCIPADLLTYEMNMFCKDRLGVGSYLHSITMLNEVSDSTEFSGGTAATAIYNLSSSSGALSSSPKQAFDPLLTNAEGTDKSEYLTKDSTPKSAIATELGRASPWVMGKVMLNCVRRSNALLHYSKNLEYSDMLLEPKNWTSWLRSQYQRTMLAAAIVIPPFRAFLPAPGEGPSREQLENGYLTLHAEAIAHCSADCSSLSDAQGQRAATETRKVLGTFHFGKDTAYLYTAMMLVETGLLLLERTAGSSTPPGGIWTPASALGHDLTARLLDRLDASMEIRFEEGASSTFPASSELPAP
jgi:short subunit dehydrogenase-like uncharacterized protein